MGRAGLRPRKAGGGADTNLNTTTFNLPAVAPVAPVAPAPVLPPVPPPPAPVVAAPTGGAAPGPITADEDGDEDQQPEEEEHDDDDQVVVPGGDAHGAGLDDDDSQRPGEAVGDTADGGGDGADLAGDGLEERGAGVPGLRPDDAGKDDPGSVDDDQAANPDDEDGRPVDEGETIDEEAGGVDLAGSSRKRRSDSGDSPESDRSTKSARISLPAIPLDRRPETWLSIREWFENDGGDPDDMDNLFSRLFVQADDEGLRIPDPPGYALFEGAPALYLDRLTRFVRTQILEWCNNSFANAITRSKDMRERLSYEQDQQNMQSHFEQGGWPWRADRQVVPLDEDAPPRPAGDPRITAERLGFGTDLVSPGKRGIWSLRSSFPAGTWCHAGLWVKTRKGRIVDRSVVKEVYLTRAEWRDNNLWENVNGTAWPMEAVTQWRLVPCEESFNVVKYAAHSTGNQMYRIYQEYCPCGNLGQICKFPSLHGKH
ncbi:hypothetical protein PRZ48_004454 [Zasmidium cellare]|uniref:Uncharacterized protein n=1 Tax=Zasmidium cellare TaxID=395010 RepID=A0ABR0EPL5_ZASCE|nr:hypothetical protein PRZ48_004454 [Zasmidium cellare]